MHPFEVSQRDLYDNNPWQVMNNQKHSSQDSAISSFDAQQNSNSQREMNSQTSQDSQTPTNNFIREYLKSVPFFRRHQANETQNRPSQNNLSGQVIKNEKEESLLEVIYQHVKDTSKYLTTSLSIKLQSLTDFQQQDADNLLRLERSFDDFKVTTSKAQQQIKNENRIILELQKKIQEKEDKIIELESKLEHQEKKKETDLLKIAKNIENTFKTDFNFILSRIEKVTETTNNMLDSSVSEQTKMFQKNFDKLMNKLEEKGTNNQDVEKIVDDYLIKNYREDENNTNYLGGENDDTFDYTRPKNFQNITRYRNPKREFETQIIRKCPNTEMLCIDQIDDIIDKPSKNLPTRQSDILYFFANGQTMPSQPIRSAESSPSISVNRMLLRSKQGCKNQIYFPYAKRGNSSANLDSNDSLSIYRRRASYRHSI